jgi:hypothetical protein
MRRVASTILIACTPELAAYAERLGRLADQLKVYRANEPDNPTIYRRGEIAEAEPAVPGWRMPVDDVFG